ncbi:MAG: peptidyl-prolyl cis-trans isomerase [Terriglobales bacterium]
MIRFLQTPSLARKIIFGVIIALACIAMVITLIPGGFLGDAFGFSAPGQGVLAKVGDQEVTISEVQAAARRALRRQFPRGGNTSQLMPLFMQNAISNLIVQKAQVYEAERMGLSVSDAEVADWLQHGPLSRDIFPGGQFIGRAAYEQYTEQAHNLTVRDFESEVKRYLLIQKLRNAITAGATVSDSQLREEHVRRNTKVKFDYALLTIDDIMKQVKPTEGELKAFFENNKGRYQNAIPEKRTVQYVVVDPAKVRNSVQVTQQELETYYKAHVDEYRVPEEVKLRQILLKTPPPGPDGKPDDTAVQQAKAKAEDILKQLKSGAKFADLAKKYSQDADSAPKGGDMGWVRLEQIPLTESRNAIAPLGPGQVSDMVQSAVGFQIFKVEDKHAARLKALAEVKAEIEPIVAAQKAASQAESLANKLETEARTTGLANAAQKNGLELRNSGPVTRSDSLPGVGQSPEFMAAVFERRVNDPPELMRLAQGYTVYQVTNVTPAQTPTLEQIRARVEEDFKRDRAQELLAQKIQELADRARAEHSLKKAAAEVGATVKSSELVGPDSQVPDIGSLAGPASVVFSLKLGEISPPIQVARGGAVMLLVGRQEPDPAAFEQQREQLRETLLEERRNEVLNQFMDALRTRLEEDGKIRVNKQEMERLLPQQQAG